MFHQSNAEKNKMPPIKNMASMQTNKTSLNNALPNIIDTKKVCVQICPNDPNATECKCSCN